MRPSYCNWLSGQEGIPEDAVVLPQGNRSGDDAAGRTIWSRTGYRLPTEAEWEYACRAGSAVSRCYGGSEAMLPKFAWYWRTRGAGPSDGPELKPNDLGLFDMLGNASQWTQDPYHRYQTGQGDSPISDDRSLYKYI